MDFALLADQFLDSYGLIAVFGIMLLKEIGVPIPIPSDLIMLGAAARAAQGKFPFAAVFLAILIPMLIGGLIQYAIAKGPGRRLVYRLGNYIGLTKERLERAMAVVRKGGALAVSVGLTTPGVRIAIVPASGLAELPVLAFLIGLVIGSTFFLAWHFAIGFVGGAILATLTNATTLPILVALVALAAIGLAGWLLMRHRTRHSTAERVGDFMDAACPICLAIGAAENIRHAEIMPAMSPK